MIISIEIQTDFDKIEHWLMIKISLKSFKLINRSCTKYSKVPY